MKVFFKSNTSTKKWIYFYLGYKKPIASLPFSDFHGKSRHIEANRSSYFILQPSADTFQPRHSYNQHPLTLSARHDCSCCRFSLLAYAERAGATDDTGARVVKLIPRNLFSPSGWVPSPLFAVSREIIISVDCFAVIGFSTAAVFYKYCIVPQRFKALLHNVWNKPKPYECRWRASPATFFPVVSPVWQQMSHTWEKIKVRTTLKLVRTRVTGTKQ